MAKEPKALKSPMRCTQARDLPAQEKALSIEEQKKVKGGGSISLLIDLTAKPKQ